MNALFIQFSLKAKGLSMADVARGLINPTSGKPLTPAAVQIVVRGEGRSKRIEDRLVELTGLSHHTLWPRWYALDGTRIKKRKRYTRMTAALARLQEIESSNSKQEAA